MASKKSIENSLTRKSTLAINKKSTEKFDVHNAKEFSNLIKQDVIDPKDFNNFFKDNGKYPHRETLDDDSVENHEDPNKAPRENIENYLSQLNKQPQNFDKKKYGVGVLSVNNSNGTNSSNTNYQIPIGNKQISNREKQQLVDNRLININSIGVNSGVASLKDSGSQIQAAIPIVVKQPN